MRFCRPKHGPHGHTIGGCFWSVSPRLEGGGREMIGSRPLFVNLQSSMHDMRAGDPSVAAHFKSYSV